MFFNIGLHSFINNKIIKYNISDNGMAKYSKPYTALGNIFPIELSIIT